MILFYLKKYTCLLLLAAGWAPSGVFAQQENKITVQASYDSSAIAELFNTITIGLTFVTPGGASTSTQGWLHGNIRWNSLRINSPQGTIADGQLTFNRQKVWQNDHKVTFYIKKGNTSFICNLPLPFVRTIRFNLYTDSLKRGDPFYLNVEGKFNTGHIYPLDTNMVAFRLSGGGVLSGNTVLVKKSDTAIHRIEVFTWLLADPQMKDSVSIPVKIIPDPTTLPTIQQIFHDWKK